MHQKKSCEKISILIKLKIILKRAVLSITMNVLQELKISSVRVVVIIVIESNAFSKCFLFQMNIFVHVTNFWLAIAARTNSLF